MRKLSRKAFPHISSTPSILLATAIVGLTIVVFIAGQQRVKLAGGPVQPPGNSMLREEMIRTSAVEKVCFVRGGWIYLAELRSKKETRLAQGVSPQLSPTGDSIVFISVQQNEDMLTKAAPPAGRFRLLNLKTMEIRDFSALDRSRTGDPIWSNNGARIAVTVAGPESKQPCIAILDSATGNLQKQIKEGWDTLTNDEGLYLSSWAPDDHSLLFHTLQDLYEVSLDDGLVHKLPASSLFQTVQISSTSQFSFSSDRRYLIFDGMIDTPDEPAMEVISVYDLTLNSVRRLTPRGVRGRAPSWLPSNKEFLFTSVAWVNDRWQSSICRMNIDGTGLTTLLRDADYGSYSPR
jgi:Tol biopolymer transport system component